MRKLAVLIGGLGTLVATTLTGCASHPPLEQRVAVPAYWTPASPAGRASFQQLARSASATSMRDQLPEHFVVMNGDVLTDLDFAELLRQHEVSGAPLTVATATQRIRMEFGVLEAADGRIIGFTEKPTVSYRVSMGVYGMSRKTLAPYPAGLSFGFDELVLDLLSRDQQPAIYEFSGYWLDIGRPDDYDEANRNFAELMPHLMRRRDEVKV